MKHYAAATGQIVVPHPAHDLPVGHHPASLGGNDGRRFFLSFGTAILAALYFGRLLGMGHADAWSLEPLVKVAFFASLLAAAAPWVWVFRVARGRLMIDASVGLAWQDLVEGLRLGHVEPGNPAWQVAANHVSDAGVLVLRYADLKRRKKWPSAELVRSIRVVGAEVHATSEMWRLEQRHLPEGRRTTPLDRLPPVTGPSVLEAADHSDSAASAAAKALGVDEQDFDVRQLARVRAEAYAQATGKRVAVQDPRHRLLDGSLAVTAARPRREITSILYPIFVVMTVVLLMVDQPALSAIPAAAALVTAVVWFVAMVTDPSELDVLMDARRAMAWGDYLAGVRQADAGALPVTTVEAVRGCELRVRATLVELMATSASASERRDLEDELFRLCSEVWALVEQAEAAADIEPG